MQIPNERGYFGEFGGRYVAETLVAPLEALEKAYFALKNDSAFQQERLQLLNHYVGRPSPLYYADRLSQAYGKAKIYLKREDLNHTGSHKINNAIGQILLARHMGKKRIIAETGAGQHGVATATVCAKFGLSCIVYMGAEDIKRQALNVYRMKLLGAEVRAVTSGGQTLKDAVNEALRDWVTHVDDTFYILGSVVGPHPYPLIVRDFQAIIGEEAKAQMLVDQGSLPDAVIASVGGGSNAMGIFHAFRNDVQVKLIGVEAGGKGIASGKHSAPLCAGKAGVLHGSRTYVMSDADGQIMEPYSISAGLDYPGKGPEHAYLKKTNRAQYVSVTDEEALKAFHDLTQLEGIMPALESSHALAYARKYAGQFKEEQILLINLSGRGDKDIHTIASYQGLKL